MNRKRTLICLALALFVATHSPALVLAVDLIESGVMAGPHEAYQIACSILEDESWMHEGIMHIRNRRLASVVISDHVAHAGTGTIVSSADIDTLRRQPADRGYARGGGVLPVAAVALRP